MFHHIFNFELNEINFNNIFNILFYNNYKKGIIFLYIRVTTDKHEY